MKKALISVLPLFFVLTTAAHAAKLTTTDIQAKFKQSCVKEMYGGMLLGIKESTQGPISEKVKRGFKQTAKNVCECAAPKIEAAISKGIPTKEISQQTMVTVQQCLATEVKRIQLEKANNA